MLKIIMSNLTQSSETRGLPTLLVLRYNFSSKGLDILQMLLILHFEPSTALVYVDLILHYLFCLDVPLNLMVKTDLPKVSLGLDTEVLGLHF